MSHNPDVGAKTKKTTKKQLLVFSGRAHPDLAEEVVGQLGTTLVPMAAYEFANS